MRGAQKTTRLQSREQPRVAVPLMRIRFQADADLSQVIVAAVLRHLHRARDPQPSA
jgi:hypothetical protein